MNETHATSRVLASWAVVATVAFGALAFGATEGWARSILRLAALVCLALAWWAPIAGLTMVPRSTRRLLAPAGLLVLVGLVQLAPLPGGLIRTVSPNTARVYADTVPPRGDDHAAWLAARAPEHGVEVDPEAASASFPAIERPSWSGRTLSVAPHTTRSALANWATCLILLVAAASLAVDPLLRYRMLWGVTLLGGVLGLIGIVQKVSESRTLLWIREPPPGTLPIGPFVNPSHYAGFVEMTVLVSVGLALALVAPDGRRFDLAALRTAVFGDPWALPRLALAAGCSVVGVAGLIISGSRGGYLALAAGLAVLVLSRRSRALVGILVASVVMVGLAAGLVTWIGQEDAEVEGVPFVLSSADPSGALRLATWGATLEIFLDHPVAGTGLGSFRWVFPAYQRAGEWKEWRHAHNDYVQLLAETGVPGLVVLVWGLVVAWARLFRPAVGTAAQTPRWTSSALAAAVIAMLVHTVVDFNLQIPSNAALFAVLVGMLAASADDAGPEGTRE